MKKIMLAGAAGLTAIAGLAATALPALAQDRDDYYYQNYRGGDDYYRYGDRDDYRYADRDDYYGDRRMCVTRYRSWDPYWGRYVIRERRYACWR